MASSVVSDETAAAATSVLSVAEVFSVLPVGDSFVPEFSSDFASAASTAVIEVDAEFPVVESVA